MKRGKRSREAATRRRRCLVTVDYGRSALASLDRAVELLQAMQTDGRRISRAEGARRAAHWFASSLEESSSGWKRSEFGDARD